MGVSKTIKRIQQKYKWENMTKDIATYVKNCKSCQLNKSSKGTKLPM